MSWQNAERDPTQFTAIRDLMLDASQHGDWLTLEEIARSTEFGEASISAQLRHLRKPRFGRYRVEKRRRQMLSSANDVTDRSGETCGGGCVPEDRADSATGESDHAWRTRDLAPWEYCVLAPLRAIGAASFETLTADATSTKERVPQPSRELVTTQDCEPVASRLDIRLAVPGAGMECDAAASSPGDPRTLRDCLPPTLPPTLDAIASRSLPDEPSACAPQEPRHAAGDEVCDG